MFTGKVDRVEFPRRSYRRCDPLLMDNAGRLPKSRHRLRAGSFRRKLWGIIYVSDQRSTYGWALPLSLR